MKKFVFCALCALAILAIVGCKGRNYKSQVMLGNEPTNYYHWTWTAQDAPWGICDKDGNTIIPRVYPKSVAYYGDYFIADSLTKQVLYSVDGKRLYEADKIERSGFKYFVIGVNNGKQSVFDLRTGKTVDGFDQMQVFACGGEVFYLVTVAEKKGVTDTQGNIVIGPRYDEVIAITDIIKGKKSGFFLCCNSGLWEKRDLAGKQTGKPTAKQVAAEKKKTANSRTVQEF